MTTVLLIADEGQAELERDLAAAGLQVVGSAAEASLLRDVLQRPAQVLVASHRHPAAALLPALAAVREHAALPVLLFTTDADTQTLAAALECGVDACVVHGYAAHRLRPLVQLARLRFERDQGQRQAMHDLAERFEERKLVDRAKGILMGAAQVPEDEAFRLLRVGSMRLKQRVGRLSQQVIEAAQAAQALNRAGVLRMLSQRVVLQQALALAGVDADRSAQEARAALARAERVLGELDKLLSAATFGDLREAAQRDWQVLAEALGRAGLAVEPVSAAKRASASAMGAALKALDARAEACLQSADRLVTALEAAGFRGEPHVVNVCGRQRMLGQRLAKQLVLAAWQVDSGDPRAPQAVAAEFDRALALLHAAPLGDADLRERLSQGSEAWARLRQVEADLRARAVPVALPPAHADAVGGLTDLSAASETLLRIFEDLTSRYERSLELLIG